MDGQRWRLDELREEARYRQERLELYRRHRTRLALLLCAKGGTRNPS
jgi:hypothetical protein